MATRRSKGDGGLYWSEARQRWIASVTVGYTPAGKRIVRRASGKTKTEAKTKLKEIIREHDDGFVSSDANYTVADAVCAWLEYGLTGRAKSTIENNRIHAEVHIIPALGKRRLRELSTEDIERFFADKCKALSTSSLKIMHSLLQRSVRHAQARDKVKRNVVLLCDVPEGRPGRPSKALTFTQAEAVLDAAKGQPIYAYIVLSLLIGARTEELRALQWSHVDLYGKPESQPPIPPSIMLWRSVREGGDTKTKKSRRTLALPHRCVTALKAHHDLQLAAKEAAGDRWKDNNLVFASQIGTELNPRNVARSFRKVIDDAGLNGADWTPRELRHSFVSIMSDNGVPIEHISRLVGHSGTSVTETVYRKQIRPILEQGANAMNEIFAEPKEPA